MSINAISSVSLYEYYYTINNDKKDKKSPLLDEMKKYGLTPTDDETVNAILLERAKRAATLNGKDDDKNKNTSKADRPWADIMYQLNLSFNEDPLDDIEDIKNELQDLLKGIQDEELERETKDLEDYVENLYVDYSRINVSKESLLTSQLNNLSVLNRVSLI